jgi:predicted small lipoprotein YifL
MTHSSMILAALLLMFTLVGCGQSGKLYLPGDPSEVQSLPSEVSLPPEEEDDEAADDDGGS